MCQGTGAVVPEGKEGGEGAAVADGTPRWRLEPTALLATFCHSGILPGSFLDPEDGGDIPAKRCRL
jgi:hypothetical protein